MRYLPSLLHQANMMLSDGNSVTIHDDSKNGKYHLRNLSDGSEETMTKEEFHKRILLGRIMSPKARSADSERNPHLDMDLSAFRDEDVTEGLRRAEYARAIITAGEPTPQSTEWKQHIVAVATAKGEVLKPTEPLADGEEPPKKKNSELKYEPSWKTVADWVRRYKEAGFDFRVLIPTHYKKGRPVLVRSDDEEAILREFDQKYMSPERPIPARLYDNLRVRYHTERQADPDKTAEWTLPARSAFYERLNRLDQHEVTRRRYGLAMAKTKFKHGGRGTLAEFPLDVVELDATESDCDVWNDEMTAVIGRPWVYVAIDRCTRMIVGIYCGFEPPSTYSLLQCVKNGVLPKNLQELYPDIPVSWDVMGAWGEAVTDNSKEALGRSFASVLGVLGTEHRLAPVKTPEFKGIVERFFKTFNEGGIQRLPGSTHGNPVKRGEYVSSDRAVLTISDFRYFIHYWLMVDYNWAWHDGIAGIPAELFAERSKTYLPRIPDGLGDIDGTFGQLHKAKLSKTGLTFLYLEYKSAYLSDLHSRYGNIELTFKVDPVDLSFIYVIDPDRKTLCAVPADDLAYTDGLTLHQHKKVLKFARERKAAWEHSEIRLELRAEFLAWSEELLRTATAKAKDARAKARTAKQGVVQPQSRQSGKEALARLLDKARAKPVSENRFRTSIDSDPSDAPDLEQSPSIDLSGFKFVKGDSHGE